MVHTKDQQHHPHCPWHTCIATNRTHENIMPLLLQLLDYITSQDPPVIMYCKSVMKYSIHSNAGYLNKANVHSHAWGYHYLSNSQRILPNNGAILAVSEIIKAVICSAAETDLGALYINACREAEIHNILQEIEHTQSPSISAASML